MEETGLAFTPEGFVGIYLVQASNGWDYARVCFAGSVPEGLKPAPEDPVILGCATAFLNIRDGVEVRSPGEYLAHHREY